MMLIGAAILIGFSHFGQAPEKEEVSDMLWRGEDFRKEFSRFTRPWFLDFKVLSALLLVLTGGVIAWFW